jgi:predicted enzyme related to lactoylglutathione lyase
VIHEFLFKATIIYAMIHLLFFSGVVMAVKQGFEEGLFCWADLATTDANLSKTFYAELFHWDVEEMPTPQGNYYLFKKGENAVCAMYELDADKKAQNIPAHWMSYISVDIVDVTVSGAKNLGATILVEPLDVMHVGRMAVIQDPEGAVVALWQSKEDGPVAYKENKTIGWNELYVKDTNRAKEFYEDLLIWEPSVGKTDDGMDYTEFHLGPEAVGGMLEIQEEWGEIPPHWALYFQVANLQEKMKTVEDLGGSVVTEVMNAENVGNFVVIQDPQGAHFLMIEMDD